LLAADLPTLRNDSGVQALELEWKEQRSFNYPLRNSSSDPAWQAFADDMTAALDTLAHPTAPTMTGQDSPGTTYRCQGVDYSFGDDGALSNLQDTHGICVDILSLPEQSNSVAYAGNRWVNASQTSVLQFVYQVCGHSQFRATCQH
jgi:hypothetical protein